MRDSINRPGLFPCIFPIVIMYYELLFRLFTVGGIFLPGVPSLLLFTCIYSGIGYLLCTLFHKTAVNIGIAGALLLLTALPFLIYSFVYRAFKVFYDLNTIFGGTGDMMSGFSGQVTDTVFSFSGILRILLFLLPGVLYLIVGRRLTAPARIGARRRLIVLAGMAALCLINGGIIALVPTLSAAYTDEYHFPTAVSDFGLLTGLRLDIREKLFHHSALLPVQGDSIEPTEENSDLEDNISVAHQPHQLDLPLDDQNANEQIKNLNAYVASLTPSLQNDYTGLFKGKNLILITAEAFSAEVIDPVLTPTLYRLANRGIRFTDYYQTAGSGTTGGEYQNIFGMLPSAGGMSFKNTADHCNYLTMGSQLDRLGYYGKVFHNNSYTYYSRDKTHINLGYSDGYMGYGNGMEKYVKKLWPESDYEMFAGTLPTYIDKQPFNVYYMTVSGHSGYGKTENAMRSRHWDRVKDLPYSDAVRGYLAANLDLEDAMAYLVKTLEEKGIADDTVICLTADHFPYGLDNDAPLGKMPYLSELYGYTVENCFQRDHSAWILWCGELEKREPIVIDVPTSSMDILPTLSNLFGTEYDSRLMPGRDVFSDTPALVFDPGYNWKTAYGTYFAASGTFAPRDKTAVLPDNYVNDMRAVVRNKIQYCKGALDTDYFAYLFKEQ